MSTVFEFNRRNNKSYNSEKRRSVKLLLAYERNQKIIGQIPIHIQTIGRTEEEMIEDARVIIEELGKDTFIKVPVNQAGLQAIKKLKKEGYLITGTAIYTELQGYLAINNGADYIAPYYNRMQNQGIDAMKVIDSLRTEIERTQRPTKILAASFKNCEQVTTAIRSGAHAITLGKELLDQVLEMPSIDKAVRASKKIGCKLSKQKRLVN